MAVVVFAAHGIILWRLRCQTNRQSKCSSKILAAKSATMDEIAAMLAANASKVDSLSSTAVRLTFASGKLDSGNVQQYRSAPGYILIERPDRIRLNIQNPLTGPRSWNWLRSGMNFRSGTRGRTSSSPAETARAASIWRG